MSKMITLEFTDAELLSEREMIIFFLKFEISVH